MSHAVTIPTLRTDRLTLRAPRLADFEHWATFFASDRSALERGPMSRRDAWSTWAADVANWTLRGYGPFGLDDRKTGAYIGEVGIYEIDSYPSRNWAGSSCPRPRAKAMPPRPHGP